MKKKFDAQTARKIINDYAEKLNYYMKENSNLKLQLEDNKTTLQINKELLFKYISQNSKSQEKNNIIQELQEENERLNEKINKIFAEKTILEKKMYKIQQELEDRIVSDKEIIDRANEHILVIENKLNEREYMISHLKNELEKYYQNDINTPKEIFLAEPDRTNLELYNELNYSRELIAKLSRMLNQEKAKANKLEEKLAELEEKVSNLKKGKKISKNLSKISILDYISSSDDGVDEGTNRSDMFNLESPVVKFPEKIKIKGMSMNKSAMLNLPIPKLDLTNVKAKYHNAKNIEIAEVNNVKATNRSSNEYIEKLKFQLKVCKNTIISFKKKVEKYKRAMQVHRQTIMNLRNKNEFLELQLKKSTGSTNDETSNTKKDMTNTSMNNNTSVRFEEDFEDDDNDEDFNYVIREYNKTVVHTTECK